MTFWRVWVSVHRWRMSVLLMLIGAIASIGVRSLVVERFGGQPIVSPVAVALLIPVLTGTGVAIGAISPDVALPDPWRAKIARCLWFTVLVAGAAVASLVGVVQWTRSALLRRRSCETSVCAPCWRT